MPSNDADALRIGVLGAVVDVLCAAAGPSVRDLGAFFAAAPLPSPRTVNPAACLNAEALDVASSALTPLYRAAQARLTSSRRDLRAATAILFATLDYVTGYAARKAELATPSCPRDFAAEVNICALLLCRDP